MDQLLKLLEGCFNLLQIMVTLIIPAINDMKHALCVAFPPYALFLAAPIVIGGIGIAKRFMKPSRH